MSQVLITNLNKAASFYRAQLRESQRAIGYLKGRGLRGDIAARYGLGYAPAGFHALRGTFSNYNDFSLEKAGLIAVNDSGRRYDRFRDRIMFPIMNEDANVVGFGGRVVEGDGPKYLNSPESEVFQKGQWLYGLTQAADSIRETGTVYVVEGYLDVVSLAQHGVNNVVGTLGTATTDDHAKRLLALAKCVIFCFDGDDAGRRAATKALEVCLRHVTDDSRVRFIFLPSTHDPDSYIRSKGAIAFRDLTYVASSLEGFFLATAIQGCQLEYPEGRARMVANASPRLQKIKAPALLQRLLKDIGSIARLSASDLIDLCGLQKNLAKSID